MDVSENNGTPKSSILIRFSIINHPFWGTPIFGNTHVVYFLTNPTLHRARSRVGVFPSAKAFPKTAKMERPRTSYQWRQKSLSLSLDWYVLTNLHPGKLTNSYRKSTIKRYLPGKMGIFQPAMLVAGTVPWSLCILQENRCPWWWVGWGWWRSLHLHTCDMLRNWSGNGLGWVGLGMMTLLALGHMWPATQLIG